MRRAFPLALAASLLAATGALAAPGTSGDPRRGAVIVESGTEAGAAACAGCHQADGAGNEQVMAPRLAGQIETYLAKQLDDYANGARRNDIMTPIAKALSDAQRADVSAFYARQQADYPPVPTADAATLHYGETLATVGSDERRVQACNNCHGPQGTGLAPSYPYLAGQFHSYLKAQYDAWQRGDRANAPEHVMATIFAQLTEADVDAVSAYFAALRPLQSPPLTGSSTPPGGSR